MTTSNQPISAVQAAALLLALVPELARAETYPQWSDGTGVEVRTTRVTAYDGEARVIELMPVQRSMVLDTLLRVVGGDWDRPQTFSVAGESLSLTYPVVPSLPVALWDSPVADDPYHRAQLDVQRHQLEDPAEPPLAVADPARDCAASLTAGLMQPVAWDEDAPSAGCVPEFVQRPSVDVPVVGDAL